MTMGLIGHKLGMTRIFDEDGTAKPVTVIEVEPNVITQIKNIESDGYNALQVSIGEKKLQRATKPYAGHFAKASVPVAQHVKEFRVDEVQNYTIGQSLTVELFAEISHVDVRARSIGKGFAGTIKRHNFSGQRRSHGNSISHRVPGSIGQNQSPGRVFKGKKMSGHMGNKMRSVQNLEVVRVDAEKNLILVKGAVPGAKGGLVSLKPTVKR